MGAPRLHRACVIAALTTVVAGGALWVVPAQAASCSPAVAPGGDWPMMGRDLTSTRTQVAEQTMQPLLRPAWTFDANRATGERHNEVTGYPIVSGGCVYVGSSTGGNTPGWVFALAADTGDVVWKTKVPGGVFASVAVAGGVVYAHASRVGGPLLVALDQATGSVRWQTAVDTQKGADAVSSPIVYDGMVWVGISGTAAEGDEADRTEFQGSTVLVAAEPIDVPEYIPVDAAAPSGARRRAQPGEVIRKLWTVPQRDWAAGFAGGSQWGTISIDPDTGYGYAGTGNPFNDEAEHAHTNAVLKIDLGRGRATFGQIVGSYKGDVEEYFPDLKDRMPCGPVDHLVFAAGVECGNLDLDFGTTPNIYRDRTGRKVVSAGQKSGVVHFFDAVTMAPISKTLLGVPSPVGGMVGSAAFDGAALYGPHSVGGYLWSVDASTHKTRWVTPVADAVHWGPPVTAANGVLYTVDLKGFLDAYDARTGAPLLHLPMKLGTHTQAPTFSWGAVTVARHHVYASIGLGLTSAGLPSMPNGYVISYVPLMGGTA
jgi:polyvinyl alcohol dehydrogenase (cytochrome)